jgi:hypothetical protein
MTKPFPGLKIFIESDGQTLEFLDKDGNIQTIKNKTVAITNYEYETRKNDEKRKILLLKPEYIGVFVSDTRNIMTYSESSQYVDNKTKKVYNPRTIGK